MRRVAAAFVAIVGALTAGLYFWANGVTAGACVLAAVPLLGVLAMGRRWRAMAAVAIAALAWVFARATRAPGAGLQVCVDAECDGRGAFWQRVPDEREAVRAGLLVSGFGGLPAAERRAFESVIETEYARLPAEWSGLPNALLMRSSPSRVEMHRWVPAGAKLPCVVFLHGFGGALTPYLRAMVESAIGKRFVIVAPALDNEGAWATPRGQAVLDRVMSELPDAVDPTRVYLVGLSNGSFGATTTMLRPERRFKGFVLVSGVGEVADAELDHTRVLLFAGMRDPRIPYSYVTRQERALRKAGADVELVSVDADHYLILTHAAEWTARFVTWSGE